MSKLETQIKQIGPGLKAMNFDAWGGIDGFLAATSNGSASARPQQLRRVLPWLAKATDMTALAVSELPFDIMQGDTVYDSSSAWKNRLGGMPSPQALLYNLAASLCLGKAYVIPKYTSRNVVLLQYCAPQTVTPRITQQLDFFDRTTSFGAYTQYAPAGTKDAENEMMYFWLPDSDVELGPAENCPANNALLSCELLTAIDSTLSIYAQRGFVPATILSAKGIPADKAKTTEEWWNRWIRGWTNTVAKIFNADLVTPTKVGAGLDELRGIYGEVTKQSIENIGTAFGIPAALFMSDMAFASEVNPLIKVWYSTSQFVKIYRCIEQTFNEQLLNRFGLTLAFRPETIDAFQTDEVQRSSAVSSFMDMVTKAGSIEMVKAVCRIYGFEIDDEAMKLIEQHFANKKENAPQIAPVVQAAPETPKPAPAPEENPDEPPMNKALDQWQRKALKRLKEKNSAACEFISADIPTEENERITAALVSCKTADEVRAVFANKSPDPILVLAREIRLTREAALLAA